MLNESLIAHQHIGDPFAPGKLDRIRHAPLVNELTRFAEEAGVSPRDVTGADYHLTDFERSYLKGFRKVLETGRRGMIYIGPHTPVPLDRMRSAVGALLRNYVSGRLLSREELIFELWDLKRIPKADLICVPDLNVSELHAAQKRAVQSYLTRRVSRGQQIAISVDRKADLHELLGDGYLDILKHFVVSNPAMSTT